MSLFRTVSILEVQFISYFKIAPRAQVVIGISLFCINRIVSLPAQHKMELCVATARHTGEEAT
jgi:hypothetical protein